MCVYFSHIFIWIPLKWVEKGKRKKNKTKQNGTIKCELFFRFLHRSAQLTAVNNDDDDNGNEEKQRNWIKPLDTTALYGTLKSTEFAVFAVCFA